jgi:hypothetical protein
LPYAELEPRLAQKRALHWVQGRLLAPQPKALERQSSLQLLWGRLERQLHQQQTTASHPGDRGMRLPSLQHLNSCRLYTARLSRPALLPELEPYLRDTSRFQEQERSCNGESSSKHLDR